MQLELRAPAPEDTRAVGAALGPLLRAGDGVALTGDLGAGKTTFVSGVARGVGYEGAVASPTFTLVREYRAERAHLLHVDVYRLDRVQDVVDLGLQDQLDDGAILLIEWGDAVESLLPEDHLVITFTAGSDETRRISVRGVGDAWAARWERIEHDLERWAA
jgi:tRNA threonylcarbamoyladenosine biosynthesis protein TsaE